MNLSLEEALRFCHNLSAKNYTNRLIICVPAPYLAYLADKFPSIEFAAQNVSMFSGNGAYTGEYSPLMLKSCKINYSLVGHSERRNLFAETDQIIAEKSDNCINAGLIPIICIGENLATRQNGNYKEFLEQQLRFSIPNNIKNNKVVIAYEPIWSIGTNLVPTKEELIATFEIIHSYLKESMVANNVCLVYGGSVNFGNIAEILSLQRVSGCLIGKASLDYQTLTQILERLY